MTDVPPGWYQTTLGELGRYLNGRGFKKSEWRESGLPIIRIQNLTGSSTSFNHYQGEAEERYTARPGDLLVSWAATLGAYIWTGPKAVVNQHIFKVESSVDTLFHKYLLDYKLEALMRKTHGSGMVHITRGKFDATPVIVPETTAEQQRVVALLEDHLSRIKVAEDGLERARRRILAMQSVVIDRAATGTVGGCIQPASKVSWAWLSPHEFTSGSRSDIAIGPFGSNLKTSDYTDAGVRLVFVRNVRSASFSLPDQKYVSPQKARELASHGVRLGDVVITKMGEPPGDAAVYSQSDAGVITADVIRIRPRPEVSSAYLAMAINSRSVARQIEEITRGVAQRKISLSRFRQEVRIPTPPFDMQNMILQRAETLLNEATRLSKSTVVASQRSKRLQRALLDLAFTGRLTGRSSDMDHAKELANV